MVLKHLNAKFSEGKSARFKVQVESDKSMKRPVLQIETDWEMHDDDDLYEELKRELDLMMWTITQSFDKSFDRQDSPDKWIFHLEPVQADDVSKYIYGECNGIIYHLAPKSATKKILRTSLRAKQASYRDFPARTYVIGADTDAVENVYTVLRSKLPQSIQLVDGPKYFDILKIDVLHTNINFYKDPYYKAQGIAYAYTNFPGCRITKIEFDDLFK